MVGLIIAFPNLVSGGLGKKADLDTSNVKIENRAPADPANKEEDPMESVRRALQQEQPKK